MISDDYHDIVQLLLLTIIVNSKNWISYCQRKYVSRLIDKTG